MSRRPDLPTKIAIVIGQLTQGGSERQLYMFLEHCDRERWTPLVYVSGELGVWENPIRKLGISVILLQGTPIVKMLQFRRSCMTNQIRQFFSWSSYTNGYSLALLGLGIPCIGSFRNDDFSDLPTRYRGLWSWISLAGISTAVSNSQETTTTLHNHVNYRKRVVYMPNAVRPLEEVECYRKIWRERLGLQDDEVLVMGIGRLAPQKNFARFIEAIALVNQTMPIRAIIAGRDDGYQESLQHQIDTSGLGKVVQFVGAVPDARELMGAADIFLLSSDYEGMPNVVLEAMAAGVPCVCTKVNGITELIEQGINGFVTDHRVEVLAEKVQLLAGDKRLRQEMGIRAGERVRSSFDPKTIAARLWQLCEE